MQKHHCLTSVILTSHAIGPHHWVVSFLRWVNASYGISLCFSVSSRPVNLHFGQYFLILFRYNVLYFTYFLCFTNFLIYWNLYWEIEVNYVCEKSTKSFIKFNFDVYTTCLYNIAIQHPYPWLQEQLCFFVSSWCDGGNINLGKIISAPAPHNKIRYHSVCLSAIAILKNAYHVTIMYFRNINGEQAKSRRL